MRRIVKKVIFAFMMEWKKIQAKKATNKDITTAKKIFFRIFFVNAFIFYVFFIGIYVYTNRTKSQWLQFSHLACNY